MYTSFEDDIATPCGFISVALVAVPPSPLNEIVPVPAMVVIIPLVDIFLIL